MPIHRRPGRLLWCVAALCTASAVPAEATREDGFDAETCTYYKDGKAIPLHGKFKIVESFADLEVQIVSSFPDLRVQEVSSFADDCGEWQYVESFPDFTVRYVSSFPDLKIQRVTSFPGAD